jgi:hypothetical protein
MLSQILIGSVLISFSVLVEAAFIGCVVVTLTRFGTWLVAGNRVVKLTVTLTAITLWLLAALSIAVWLWAVTFLALELFETLEAALYFAVVAFTTLGFGDVILEQEWRLLSGFIAANGLILFSLSTAFLIEAMRRLHDAQADRSAR